MGRTLTATFTVDDISQGILRNSSGIMSACFPSADGKTIHDLEEVSLKML